MRLSRYHSHELGLPASIPVAIYDDVFARGTKFQVCCLSDSRNRQAGVGIHTPSMSRRIAAYFPDTGAAHISCVISAMRRMRWFRWTAFLALLCAIGLYAAEASHHHKTRAGELRCPVCHTIAHGALDVFVPGVDSAPQFGSGYLLTLSRARQIFRPQSFAVRPQSRAPPFLFFIP